MLCSQGPDSNRTGAQTSQHRAWTSVELRAIISAETHCNDQLKLYDSMLYGAAPRSVPVKEQGPFRFFNTTNPNQLRDPAEMRKNRKHVMKDYLRKEKCKAPGTRDVRAGGSTQTDKRRRLDPDNRKSKNLAAPNHIFGPGALTPQSSCDGTAISESEGTMTIASGPASQAPHDKHQNLVLIPQSVPGDEDKQPACACAEGDPEHLSGSCQCSSPEQNLVEGSSVPDLSSILDLRVRPCYTWLQMTKTAINLEKLKFACGLRLRSYKMAEIWLPNLIKARHSFLSTLCISTAHDEAMQRGALGSDSLRGAKQEIVYERLAVKGEVISMVNTCLDDPQQRTSDATIIAVLNVLNSEMISRDTNALKTHQRGLNKMICMRGGLCQLGVLGHLARTVTVTMLVDAVLQEDPADDMYLLFAHTRTTTLPTNEMLFPESPVYCGQRYSTVAQKLGASESLTLLELLRDMTCVLQVQDAPNIEILKYLHGKVWKVESALPESVPSRQDRTNEAIRLTARLYADALVRNVSFSQASSFPVQNGSPTTQGHTARPATFVDIVRQLRHTELDRIWGELSGVLFWITLVAGAAAKGAKVKDINEAADLAIEREEEEARQWLTAVAVRCSVILGFEHGTATLGCLRNMLDIQNRLSRSDAKQRQRRRQRMSIGPVGTPVSPNGFGDFAREFLVECT